jgi:SAM-dependent methyltransferase
LPGGQHFPVLAEKSVIGGGYRANMFCPVCGSTDRDRLIYLFLKNRAHLLPKGTRLLHVAPETKFGAWLRAKRDLDYASADLDMEGVDHVVDLTKIPFPDASYDAVICNHVLEHIPDDAKAMTEIFRILKPDGWAILQTPISATLDATYEDFSITAATEREKAFGQCDHVRIYAIDYVDRLTRAGFAVEPFHWRANSGGFGGECNRFGLNEREIVFFASRPQIAVDVPVSQAPTGRDAGLRSAAS